jgi:hypothetical protein
MLPIRTIEKLHPFETGIFGLLKIFLQHFVNSWVKSYQKRSVKRIKLGIVIGGVLETAVPLANAVSAFKATRIFPLDPDAKPEK